MQKFKNYINGEFVESKSGNSFKTIDPSTEKEFAEVSAAEEYEFNLAVDSANNAFHGEWSKILPYQRAHYLRAIGDQLKEKAELLGTVETKNTGKLYKETKFQANYIAEYYYYYAGLVDKVDGSNTYKNKFKKHNTKYNKKNTIKHTMRM
jgi:aldehyde dehydrogenase (NAD+)/betaine-aldehyde dehydrogenase